MTKQKQRLLQAKIAAALYHEEGRVPTTAEIEKWTKFAKVPDFSVVLFRPTFMLVSEKNRMKVHKNQWLLTMPYPLERLAGATSRGHTMAPEGQKPSQWLCLTNLPREMYP